MRAVIIEPGTIWEAKPLTPEFLEDQWVGTLLHTSANLNLSKLAFSENDLQAWEWNAREVLDLNRSRGKIIKTLITWSIPQNKINFHLIHAFQKLISGWQQWVQLQTNLVSSNNLSESKLSFLILSALGRLEQAQLKQDSLTTKKQILQSVSLRQHRFYQHITAILLDLDPVVKSATALSDCSDSDMRRILSLQNDLCWHAGELTRLVGTLEHTPDLIKRILKPRIEINRLLGTVCQYHASCFKLLVN